MANSATSYRSKEEEEFSILKDPFIETFGEVNNVSLRKIFGYYPREFREMN